MKQDALDELGLPISIVEAHIAELNITIPWSTLGLSYDSVKVVCKGLRVVVQPTTEHELDITTQSQRLVARKLRRLNQTLSSQSSSETASDTPSESKTWKQWCSTLFSGVFASTLFRNLHLCFENVELIYRDTACGMNFQIEGQCQSITSETVNAHWMLFEDTAPPASKNDVLTHKIVRMTKASLSWQSLDDGDEINCHGKPQLIVAPTDMLLKIRMNDGLDATHPKFFLSVMYLQISIQVSIPQLYQIFQSISKCIDGVQQIDTLDRINNDYGREISVLSHEQQQQQRSNSFSSMPIVSHSSSRRNKIRQRWTFAFYRVRNHLQLQRHMKSWPTIVRLITKQDEYRKLFLLQKQAKGSQKDVEFTSEQQRRLQQLQIGLPFAILFAVEQEEVRREVERNSAQGNGEEEGTWGAWFSSFYKTLPDEQQQHSNNDNGDKNEAVFQTLREQEQRNLEESPPSSDFQLVRIEFECGKISVELVDEKKRHSPLFHCTTNASISYQQHLNHSWNLAFTIFQCQAYQLNKEPLLISSSATDNQPLGLIQFHSSSAVTKKLQIRCQWLPVEIQMKSLWIEQMICQVQLKNESQIMWEKNQKETSKKRRPREWTLTGNFYQDILMDFSYQMVMSSPDEVDIEVNIQSPVLKWIDENNSDIWTIAVKNGIQLQTLPSVLSNYTKCYQWTVNNFHIQMNEATVIQPCTSKLQLFHLPFVKRLSKNQQIYSPHQIHQLWKSFPVSVDNFNSSPPQYLALVQCSPILLEINSVVCAKVQRLIQWIQSHSVCSSEEKQSLPNSKVLTPNDLPKKQDDKAIEGQDKENEVQENEDSDDDEFFDAISTSDISMAKKYGAFNLSLQKSLADTLQSFFFQLEIKELHCQWERDYHFQFKEFDTCIFMDSTDCLFDIELESIEVHHQPSEISFFQSVGPLSCRYFNRELQNPAILNWKILEINCGKIQFNCPSMKILNSFLATTSSFAMLVSKNIDPQTTTTSSFISNMSICLHIEQFDSDFFEKLAFRVEQGFCQSLQLTAQGLTELHQKDLQQFLPVHFPKAMQQLVQQSRQFDDDDDGLNDKEKNPIQEFASGSVKNITVLELQTKEWIFQVLPSDQQDHRPFLSTLLVKKAHDEFRHCSVQCAAFHWRCWFPSIAIDEDIPGADWLPSFIKYIFSQKEDYSTPTIDTTNSSEQQDTTDPPPFDLDKWCGYMAQILREEWITLSFICVNPMVSFPTSSLDAHCGLRCHMNRIQIENAIKGIDGEWIFYSNDEKTIFKDDEALSTPPPLWENINNSLARESVTNMFSTQDKYGDDLKKPEKDAANDLKKLPGEMKSVHVKKPLPECHFASPSLISSYNSIPFIRWNVLIQQYSMVTFADERELVIMHPCTIRIRIENTLSMYLSTEEHQNTAVASASSLSDTEIPWTGTVDNEYDQGEAPQSIGILADTIQFQFQSAQLQVLQHVFKFNLFQMPPLTNATTISLLLSSAKRWQVWLKVPALEIQWCDCLTLSLKELSYIQETWISQTKDLELGWKVTCKEGTLVDIFNHSIFESSTTQTNDPSVFLDTTEALGSDDSLPFISIFYRSSQLLQPDSDAPRARPSQYALTMDFFNPTIRYFPEMVTLLPKRALEALFSAPSKPESSAGVSGRGSERIQGEPGDLISTLLSVGGMPYNWLQTEWKHCVITCSQAVVEYHPSMTTQYLKLDCSGEWNSSSSFADENSQLYEGQLLLHQFSVSLFDKGQAQQQERNNEIEDKERIPLSESSPSSTYLLFPTQFSCQWNWNMFRRFDHLSANERPKYTISQDHTFQVEFQSDLDVQCSFRNYQFLAQLDCLNPHQNDSKANMEVKISDQAAIQSFSSSHESNREVKEENEWMYENQRFFGPLGWSSRLLPTDPFPWMDEQKLGFGDLKEKSLPRYDNFYQWQWKMPWKLYIDEKTDQEGWQYAFHFPQIGVSSAGLKTLKRSKSSKDLVRRRKWYRVRLGISKTETMDTQPDDDDSFPSSFDYFDNSTSQKTSEEDENEDDAFFNAVEGEDAGAILSDEAAAQYLFEPVEFQCHIRILNQKQLKLTLVDDCFTNPIPILSLRTSRLVPWNVHFSGQNQYWVPSLSKEMNECLPPWTLSMETTWGLDTLNQGVAVWEPVIEPIAMDIQFQHNHDHRSKKNRSSSPSEPQMVLAIETSNCLLNISHAAVQTFSQAHSNWNRLLQLQGNKGNDKADGDALPPIVLQTPSSSTIVSSPSPSMMDDRLAPRGHHKASVWGKMSPSSPSNIPSATNSSVTSMNNAGTIGAFSHFQLRNVTGVSIKFWFGQDYDQACTVENNTKGKFALPFGIEATSMSLVLFGGWECLLELPIDSPGQRAYVLQPGGLHDTNLVGKSAETRKKFYDQSPKILWQVELQEGLKCISISSLAEIVNECTWPVKLQIKDDQCITTLAPIGPNESISVPVHAIFGDLQICPVPPDQAPFTWSETIDLEEAAIESGNKQRLHGYPSSASLKNAGGNYRHVHQRLLACASPSEKTIFLCCQIQSHAISSCYVQEEANVDKRCRVGSKFQQCHLRYVLHPPLMLSNHLPMTVRFQLGCRIPSPPQSRSNIQSSSKHSSETLCPDSIDLDGKVDPITSQSIHTIRFGLNPLIRFQFNGTRWSPWIRIEDINTTSSSGNHSSSRHTTVKSSEDTTVQSIEFPEYNGRRTQITMTNCPTRAHAREILQQYEAVAASTVDPIPNVSRTLVLSCDVWLKDATGLSLVFGRQFPSFVAQSSITNDFNPNAAIATQYDAVQPFPGQNAPIMEMVYQNQRWTPLGWGPPSLPTDRAEYTDERGQLHPRPDEVELQEGWTWAHEWMIDARPLDSEERSKSQEGWWYASDFKSSFHAEKTAVDFVRRRLWVRAHIPPKYILASSIAPLCPISTSSFHKPNARTPLGMRSFSSHEVTHDTTNDNTSASAAGGAAGLMEKVYTPSKKLKIAVRIFDSSWSKYIQVDELLPFELLQVPTRWHTAEGTLSSGIVELVAVTEPCTETIFAASSDAASNVASPSASIFAKHPTTCLVFYPRIQLMNHSSQHLLIKQFQMTDALSLRPQQKAVHVWKHHPGPKTSGPSTSTSPTPQEFRRMIQVTYGSSTYHHHDEENDELEFEYSGGIHVDRVGSLPLRIHHRDDASMVDILLVHINRVGEDQYQLVFEDALNVTQPPMYELQNHLDTGVAIEYAPFHTRNKSSSFGELRSTLMGPTTERRFSTLKGQTSTAIGWNNGYDDFSLQLRLDQCTLSDPISFRKLAKYPKLRLASGQEISVRVYARDSTRVLSIHYAADDDNDNGDDKVHPPSKAKALKANTKEPQVIIKWTSPLIFCAWIDSEPKELMNMIFTGFDMVWSQSSVAEQLDFSLSSIRIDNMTHHPLSYGSKSKSSSQDQKSECILWHGMSSSESFLDVSVSTFTQSSGIWFHFEHLMVAFRQPIHLALDDALLQACVDMYGDFVSLWTVGSTSVATSSVTASGNHQHPLSRRPPQPLVHFDLLHFYPLDVVLSYKRHHSRKKDDHDNNTSVSMLQSKHKKTFLQKLWIDSIGLAIGSLREARISLNAFVLPNTLLTLDELLYQMDTFYRRQALSDVASIAGSSQLLGNPAEFMFYLNEGVHGLVEAGQEEANLVIGIARGAKSLVGNTLLGLSQSANGITTSLSKGLESSMVSLKSPTGGFVDRDHDSLWSVSDDGVSDLFHESSKTTTTSSSSSSSRGSMFFNTARKFTRQSLLGTTNPCHTHDESHYPTPTTGTSKPTLMRQNSRALKKVAIGALNIASKATEKLSQGAAKSLARTSLVGGSGLSQHTNNYNLNYASRRYGAEGYLSQHRYRPMRAFYGDQRILRVYAERDAEAVDRMMRFSSSVDERFCARLETGLGTYVICSTKQLLVIHEARSELKFCLEWERMTEVEFFHGSKVSFGIFCHVISDDYLTIHHHSRDSGRTRGRAFDPRNMMIQCQSSDIAFDLLHQIQAFLHSYGEVQLV